MTVRVTDVYRKIDGKWLIVQEHVSVPIDFSRAEAGAGYDVEAVKQGPREQGIDE